METASRVGLSAALVQIDVPFSRMSSTVLAPPVPAVTATASMPPMKRCPRGKMKSVEDRTGRDGAPEVKPLTAVTAA